MEPTREGAEELDFGRESAAETRLRELTSAYRWPLIAVAVIVALAGAGGWYILENAGKPQAPPDGPWPTTGDYTVTMCIAAVCGDAATREERLAVERTLRSLPEVGTVLYRSPKEVYDRFAAMVDNAELVAATDVNDIPEAFEGELRSTDDIEAFVARLDAMPGVAGARVARPSFWAGKVDVAVLLCPDNMNGRLGPKCDDRGAATRQEREAIEERLSSIPGVGTIYYSDREHARRVEAHMTVSGRAPEPVLSGYYIKLEDKAAAQAVERAMDRLPGVDRVAPVAP
ncbi:permease-like cell division protein FtsX [Spongiactinospora sp. TRM90649]|uniref:permease-like cell division protein FtsX n=1 Tax=Spongiactinospora sp. TRM90649 TaxID=3031114 RepID=UPI0023F97BBD|nr:permease-like cell division protein FtsX [Spongiactinospora sp. TRM90649]MDF5751185.1 permease-like cell division protein FtsX [Spongiactinospora sp. TRM90649]